MSNQRSERPAVLARRWTILICSLCGEAGWGSVCHRHDENGWPPAELNSRRPRLVEVRVKEIT